MLACRVSGKRIEEDETLPEDVDVPSGSSLHYIN